MKALASCLLLVCLLALPVAAQPGPPTSRVQKAPAALSRVSGKSAAPAAPALPATSSDFVIKLSANNYALVHKKLAAKEKALTKAGWKRVYGIYQNTRNTLDDALSYHLAYQPGTAYTAIAATLDHEAFLKLVDESNSHNLDHLYKDTCPAGGTMILSDFHVEKAIEDLWFAAVAGENDKTTPGGMLVFARPVDQRRDFDVILADAPSGFANLRSRATKDSDGVDFWIGALGMGVKSRMIFVPSGDHKKQYILSVPLSNLAANRLLTDVLAVVNERIKAGLYTGKDWTVPDGTAITGVYDKNEVQLIQIASSANRDILQVTFLQP